MFGMRQSGLSVATLGASAMLLLTSLLGACTSFKTAPERGGQEIKSFMPVIGGATNGGGSLILAYDFVDPVNVVGDGGCRLRIENTTLKKSVFVPLKAQENGVFVNLEPGTYMARRLGCGVSRVWDLEDLYPRGFTVESGKTSVLGKLTFILNNKWQLETVKKGSRVENAESLAQLIQSAPQGAADNLISAFTLKPITSEMYQGERREGFDVFGLGVSDPDRVLAPLLADLKTCGNDAAKRDPLRIGQLEYLAVYKQGSFVELRDRKDSNSFSDDFRGCIEKSLQRFRPTASGEIRIRTRL